MQETIALIQLLFSLALPAGATASEAEWAAAARVLEARLAALSVKNARVFRDGERLIVEVPAPPSPEDEAALVRELVHPGTLGFHPEASEEMTQRERARRAAEGAGYAPPAGHAWLSMAGARDAPEMLVDLTSGFDREIVDTMAFTADRSGWSGVAFRVRERSVPGWRAFTRSLLDKRLAIVWGRQVVSAPVVKEELGAAGSISFPDAAEAKRLVRLFLTPPLPLPLELAERRPLAR